MTFAILFVAMAGFVGFGIDTYRAQSAKIAVKQVVTRTCERIQANASMATQTSKDVLAQASAFAASQVVANLPNANYQVTNSGNQYTVTGSYTVPVTFMRVLGAADVPVSATATCDSTAYALEKCVAPVFSQNAPLGITLANGVISQKHVQSSGATQTTTIKTGLPSGADYVVSLARDGDPPTTYYRASYKGDYSDSFTISSGGAIGTFGSSPTSGITVLDTDILYLQLVNSDGSIPMICPSSQTTTTTTTTTSTSTTPGTTAPKGDCGPAYDKYSGQSPTKSLYNSSKFVSTTSFSYGSQAAVNGKSVIPLAANYEANKTSIQVAGITASGNSTTFSSTYQDLYVFNMINQNAANLKSYIDSGMYLAFVRGPTSAIWVDGKGACTQLESPIALDLAGLGRIVTTGESTAPLGRRTAIGRTVMFDILGDGHPVAVEWLVGNGQGFLVDNRDGQAARSMDGRRLFGTADGHADGYAKLAEFDHSETGILQGSDLDGLAVWIDDGTATATEANVIPVRSLGITQISVRAERQDDGRGGEVIRSWAMRDGQRIMTEDVWLGIKR